MIKPLISIIFPVYFNEPNLPHLAKEIDELISIVDNYSFEFIFVDDGSRDKSFEQMQKLLDRIEAKVTIMQLTRNFGQGAAVRAGFEIASGDIVGTISSDQQDPLIVFKEMLLAWEKGCKVILAARNNRSDGFILDKLSINFFKFISKKIIPGFPEMGCDVFLIDKEVKEELLTKDERGNHIVAILLALGYKSETIFYKREPRKHGKNQTKIFKRILALYDTILSNSFLPIRAVTVIGVFWGGAGILYGLSIIIYRILNPLKDMDSQGWASIITMISVFSGITLFSLGIIGEYLWRILENIKKTKWYTAKKIEKNNYYE